MSRSRPTGEPTRVIRAVQVRDVRGDEQGARYLVDRIWPRGIRKDSLDLTGWDRDVAPSNALRQWFGHDPELWADFRRRYTAELDERPDPWLPLVEAAWRGDVLLLFGARDRTHNNAVVLGEYLEQHLP